MRSGGMIGDGEVECCCKIRNHFSILDRMSCETPQTLSHMHRASKSDVENVIPTRCYTKILHNDRTDC